MARIVERFSWLMMQELHQAPQSAIRSERLERTGQHSAALSSRCRLPAHTAAAVVVAGFIRASSAVVLSYRPYGRHVDTQWEQ